ncbi:glycosyltransferase family 39 protein [Coxiella burnetii]|uniref:glycosyltransferase family 39 protein n=1 Tax=Coxiella burnetii TaxID=777 RepID=UPI000183D11D|nr:UDP-phosphomannose--protein mannosyltransferase [Coxiella burnetii]ACJ18721.1 undecaprenyl-phosphomannose:protein mannosyltransferase [Coxiella burnetii CbuG_Q212]ATN67100.1 UDP-phosphomannose--protein mannosyltransferase [Coxiella burnetii]OYK85875.1 UDP-phosphomannose--protein mannosyltransferase [Coxiella burnetii]
MKNTVPTASDSLEQTSRWFWAFCLFHMAFFTLLPAFIRPQLSMDSVEGIAWGNQWQWGYSKHPFLAPWLTALFTKIFHAVDWPVYFVSQLMVVTCFIAIWRLARFILTPTQALISVLLLDGVYIYNTGAFEFNPNIVMLATWALTVLFFYRALTKDQWSAWVWTGVMAGLAMDTKYESILLYASLFLFLLINPVGRRTLATSKPYVSVVIALFVFMPNLIWLIQYNFAPVYYASDELTSQTSFWSRHFYYAFRFLYENISLLIPLLGLAIPLYFCQRDKEQKLNLLDRQFLWIVGLGPFVLTLLFSAIGGFHLVSRWGYPFFSLSGLLLIALIKPVIDKRRLLHFLSLYLILIAFIPIGYAIYMQKLTTAYSNLFPGPTFSQRLEKIWREHYPHQPLVYVAGSRVPLYYLASYAHPQAIAYFDWDKRQSPWINETTLKKEGALFIYSGPHFPPSIFKRYPNLILLPMQRFAPNYSRKNKTAYLISVALLPPVKYDKH